MGPAPMTISFFPRGSELERDIGKAWIVECALQSFAQWSGRHVEYSGPVDDLEHFRNDQRLQLRGGKRRVTVEQCIYRQQQPKHRIRDVHDGSAGAGHAPDLLDEIDIVDLAQPGDVVFTRDARLQTGRDDGTEITRVQRLAQIPSAAGNGK